MEEINNLLEELAILEHEVKAKVKRIQVIKEWCKGQGSFCTDRYLVAIENRTREGMRPLKDCVKALGRDLLESLNLISRSHFEIVHVSRTGMLNGDAESEEEQQDEKQVL